MIALRSVSNIFKLVQSIRALWYCLLLHASRAGKSYSITLGLIVWHINDYLALDKNIISY